MHIKKKSIFRNALYSIWENRRKYLLLSITVFLSFSAFLFFLIFEDSTIFDTYKECLRASSKIALADYSDNQPKDIVFQDKVDKVEGTKSYIYYEQQVQQELKGDDFNLVCKVNIVPRNVWAFYYSGVNRFELINGRKDFTLNKNQVIINQDYYNKIKNDTDENGKLYLNLEYYSSGGKMSISRFEVVGVCLDNGVTSVTDEQGRVTFYEDVFVSVENFEGMVSYGEKKELIYSENIDEIIGTANDLGITLMDVYSAKQNMNKQIVSDVRIKEILAIALIFILGLNLRFSFQNTLIERNYEISVRRALGARNSDIIIQFVIEGFIVMLINILCSVAVVTELLNLYKIYQRLFFQNDWSIILEKYSIIIFLCTTIFLSIAISIDFAIKSCKVEIIKYIKGV